MSEPSLDPTQPVVARGGEYYLRMRYFLAVLLVAFGGYFAYDGWHGYPVMNQKRADVQAKMAQALEQKNEKQHADLVEQLKDLPEHNEMAILLQKVLAFVLPGLGLVLVGWARHNARGEIRLAGETLSAPGHPAITLDQVTALDKRLWDRKDIAFVEYETGAAKGRIRLDAFVYQTDPIVKIYDRIEALMNEDAPDARPQEEESPQS